MAEVFSSVFLEAENNDDSSIRISAVANKLLLLREQEEERVDSQATTRDAA
jgi:hypothetical protein